MSISHCCYVGPHYENGGCNHPTRFIARLESEPKASIFVCGKHLAAALNSTMERYIVVAVADQHRG
jgi:hypothetical protein